MPRYKLTLEYDGTPFVGWQRQLNGLSVQQVLEDAAHNLSGHSVTAAGAGRTDTGVHALGMTAHLDLEKSLPPHRVRDALNHHMRPHPVGVLTAEEVSEDFHARFSCFHRHYLYRIICRRAPLALDAKRVWRVGYELDVGAMQAAAQHLVGKHDFTTFRSTHCQAKSPIKTLSTLIVSRHADEVQIRCSAPSFLHNQVRSIAGTLERVGAGRWQPASVRESLEAKTRSACGPVAPPHGLYFVKADYPPFDQ
ncbi:tRNA pseudouridine(38-40) synthase TruA [Parvularcula sp. IMCC14364]|uniref:tRNA pseudouridine(38-40) synthase TruA n=1 Tax=Parvularcula sp. IMCC14364 TaxID=3067902 RepID=UPI0027428D8F|nr:tRNA pseudouridine(38-40) synthase TruA [Parvularcula sp. IMCC14364]